MNKVFGFYVLGYKGYSCLRLFIEEFGSDCVSFVVSDRDQNIEEDCYEMIERLCSENRVVFSNRASPVENNAVLKFAIGWRWLISEQENLIVFHDSLLPKYRGFAPLVNSLINGEAEVGVTALKAESKYDSGDILGQKSMSVAYPKKIRHAIDGVANLYSNLLIEICRKVINGEDLVGYPQDTSLASYSPWRDNDDYKINWSRSARYISRFIDAVGYPYKGSETTINGKYVRILDSEVLDDINIEDRSSHLGKVLFMENGLPVVICGEGLLRVTEIFDDESVSMVGKFPFRSRLGG